MGLSPNTAIAEAALHWAARTKDLVLTITLQSQIEAGRLRHQRCRWLHRLEQLALHIIQPHRIQSGRATQFMREDTQAYGRVIFQQIGFAKYLEKDLFVLGSCIGALGLIAGLGSIWFTKGECGLRVCVFVLLKRTNAERRRPQGL